MGKFIIVIICLLMSSQCWATHQMSLTAVLPDSQVQEPANIGEMKVEGVGLIKFTADRKGQKITIQAAGSENQVLGRAESVAGVSETPIFINTAKGLQQIIIRWKSSGK